MTSTHESPAIALDPLLKTLLDAASQPAIVGDTHWFVLYLNPAAARWLERHQDTIAILDGRLAPAGNATQMESSFLTDAALRTGSNWGRLPALSVRHLFSITQRTTVDASTGQAVPIQLLSISGSGVTEAATARKHAQCIGLTGAETRVYVAFCEGLQPRQIAQTLFICEDTVRTHLRSIRAKADARTLRDLTGLAGTLPLV